MRQTGDNPTADQTSSARWAQPACPAEPVISGDSEWSRRAMLLRRGDRGPAVADLREALASLQLLPSLNGTDRAVAEFDAATDGAIRDFQQRRGLIVDGIVGPVTVRSLTDARWNLGDRSLTHTLSAPMTGDDVMALQTRLAEMGYNTGRPDGIFGPLTDLSVRDFQRHRG